MGKLTRGTYSKRHTWRHDLQTESTGSRRSELIGDSCSVVHAVNVTTTRRQVESSRNKQNFTVCRQLNPQQNVYIFWIFIFWKLTEWCHFLTYLWNDARSMADVSATASLLSSPLPLCISAAVYAVVRCLSLDLSARLSVCLSVRHVHTFCRNEKNVSSNFIHRRVACTPFYIRWYKKCQWRDIPLIPFPISILPSRK